VTALWPLPIFGSRGYERSWQALFTLFERGRRGDGTRWLRVFHRLYVRESAPDGTVHTDYNGLVLRRVRDGDRVRTSLLGPLVTRTSGVDGTHWSWFDLGGDDSSR
jgi:hypothetical protein